jgi:NAD(P)-dependent dehydrogenase (short-subunit alcohol dehydrogenase family)
MTRNQYDLTGITVMITGASRGLGAALAAAFGAAGAGLSICGRDRAALERVADGIRASGARCSVSVVDVRDAASLAAWTDRTAREVGEPGVLINNASVLGPRVPLREHDADAWRETLDVNLTGAFLATRAVLPSLLARGGGSIINVSSGAALPPRVEWGAYAVSKHALEGFSLNLAEELRGSGVRVNVVDPGAMRTGMRAAAYPEEDPGTLDPPAAVVGVFLWLASDGARGVSGERFRAAQWQPE